MGIFKKPQPQLQKTSPPEELESEGEIKHIENLSINEEPSPVISPASSPTKVKPEPEQEINYREIPVCLSQTQINNLIIENNIMLKQIISNIDE